MIRDIGRSVNEAYTAFKKIKDFTSTADTIETIQSFLEYSISIHQENMGHINPISGYHNDITIEALDNIKVAYDNIINKYQKQIKG